ncbi:MAG: gamma-glutamylcyclotransferase [Sediminibacterium sp.]
MSENLFSYGTLQTESVQLHTFGRKLEGWQDVLNGFQLSQLEIKDTTVIAASGETHHPVIRHTGHPADTISGTVFTITETELRQADDYEVDDYKRIAVTLQSGTRAWVYISANEE